MTIRWSPDGDMSGVREPVHLQAYVGHVDPKPRGQSLVSIWSSSCGIRAEVVRMHALTVGHVQDDHSQLAQRFAHFQ
jgi:hypothetical protein